MAIVCIAGISAGIGKTSVAEALLRARPGLSVARVRVAGEVGESDAALLADADHRIVTRTVADGDAEVSRLLAAGASAATVLLAQPRGLADGIKAMLARLPANADLLIEGNAYLWAGEADVAIMVLGPGPSGRGIGRVQPSVSELFGKIDIWAWNTRRDPSAEGFFDFPRELGRMGYARAITNRSDFLPINPLDASHEGVVALNDSLGRAMERRRWHRESDEFLRKVGFDP